MTATDPASVHRPGPGPADQPAPVLRRRGFVLAGGGTHAAAQAGMLRALLEHGIEPDLLVGTSAGALNSAFVARSPDLARVERLAELWRSAPARQIFPVRPRALVLGITGRRDYLVPNEGLRRWIVDCLDFTMIEETAIPLHIVATELLTGLPVVLSEGPVTPALMASTAIPGVFAPVTIGGRLLVDGGVASDTPVGEAADLGATDIWVLPAAGIGADRPPKGALAVLLRAIATLTTHQIPGPRVDLGEEQTAVHLLPSPPASDISIFDLRHSAELIQRGYEVASRWLDDTGLDGPVAGTAATAGSD